MSVLSLILFVFGIYMMVGIAVLVWMARRPCYEFWMESRPEGSARPTPLHAWPRDLVAYLRWRMHRRMWAHNKNDC